MLVPDFTADWRFYLLIVAGSVGAVAGLAGLVMGYTARKGQAEARALELRLRLGKLESELREMIGELPRTMQRAERTNLTLATSSGVRQTASSALQKELDEDFATLAQLEAALPQLGGDYALLSMAELEARVLLAYQHQSKVQRLDQKYRTVLMKDYQRRQQLADDRRVLLEAKLKGGGKG